LVCSILEVLIDPDAPAGVLRMITAEATINQLIEAFQVLGDNRTATQR